MVKLTLAILVLFVSTAQAASHPSHEKVNHFAGDLEMSGLELQAIFMQVPAGKQNNQEGDISSRPDDPLPEAEKLKPILEAGKKMYQWIAAINAALPPGENFTLSTAETQRAYPIDRPMSYNVAAIEKMMAEFEAAAPQLMKDVILSPNPVTQSMPVPAEEFRTAGLLLDKAYGFSQRWLLLLPEIKWYREAKIDDVRGFYALSNEKDLEKKLKGFKDLSKEDQERLSKALVGICLNAGVEENLCQLQLAYALMRDRVLELYNEFIPAGRETWNEYFAIPVDKARKDVTWKFSNPYVMEVPLLDPNAAVVSDFLATNIEDEFKLGGWQLKLRFLASGDPKETIHIKLVPGSLPHVNDLGGNEITMDGNAPLSEYNVRWTIRHEYGHSLAFPDCYHEFWDDALPAFVSYQLDITNLMCSRRGHLKPEHFEELKRVYLKLN